MFRIRSFRRFAASVALALFGLAPASLQAGGFPQTVVDVAGHSLRLDQKPQRIASAFLGSDEIVLSLVDPSRVIMVTTFGRDPAASWVAEKAKAKGIRAVQSLDAETLVALRPDIIFVNRFSNAQVVGQLRVLQQPVYDLGELGNIADILDAVRRIGAALGEEAAAGRIVADAERRLGEVQRRVADQRRPTVLSTSPWEYAPGSGTALDEIITRAGGINAAARLGVKGYQKISKEQIVAMNPDVILIDDGSEQEGFREQLLRDPALAGAAAVKNRRIIVLPGKELASLSHFIVRAVEHLSQALHPEAWR